MASSGIASRAYRLGFLFVVTLLAGVAGYTLWSELRTNEKMDRLVAASMERERLIGLIRLDAALLAEAVDDHIQATTEFEREAADKAMTVILEEIDLSTERYTADLPRGELELWDRFNAICKKLVRKVATTVKYSSRKEAERAKKHLEEEVRPITFELDEVAGQLARKNADEATRVLRQLEDLRLQTTVFGSAVVGLAVFLSLGVAWQVTRLLRKQETTIASQMGELNRRNQELDSFASRVAHDLISPLSPLKGYLTLARRSAGDAAVKELLEQAESSTSRMSELVDALLRFCRAANAHEKAVGSLDTAVSTILLEVAQAAAAQHVALERHLEKQVMVRCAPTLLQSIAQNLLSNAVKYTAGKPDAKVVVRVTRDKAEAVFEVTDNGPGMTEASRLQLFTPFFRAPETRQVPGHGLGLATTKRLVEAHGGSITFVSLPSAGTQVTVRLPLADREAPRLPEPSTVTA